VTLGSLLLLTLLPAAEPAPELGTRLFEYDRVLFLPDPEGRVVATAFHFPAGSAEDPIGGEGSAHLLGRVIERSANRRLLSAGARVEIEVAPERFLLTILAPPDRWREAVREVADLLYGGALPEDEVLAAREAHLEILRFEAGSPGRGFELERAALLLGVTHPAARPGRGTPGTVPAIGSAELSAFRAAHLREERAIVVVTGPIDESEVRLAFRGRFDVISLGRSFLADQPTSVAVPEPGATVEADSDLLPAPPRVRIREEGIPPLRAPGAGASASAWVEGERVVVDRELTSTWIAQAFPFPPGTSPLLLDFLAHLAREDLNRSPPDPGLFESQVAVERVRGAPVIVVSASVDPFRASDWESRLAEAFDSIGAAPPTGAFFELTRRRFRSSLLLELAHPEHAVRWIARNAAIDIVPPPDPELEIWRLERDAVGEAARAAGPRRTLVYGPQGLGGP
jgi:hypothetical protein